VSRTPLALIALILLATRTPAAEVPFALEHGLITIDVELGEDTLPLMLDLGDFRAISLSSDVLDSVDVEFTGEVDQFVNFAGDPFEARRFVVPRVALGPVVHVGLEGSEDVFDPSNPSPNPFGAIGRAFFDGHALTIDYSDWTLSLDAPTKSGCLPLDTTSGMLRVSATIDGAEHVFLVDTGAQVSVIDPSVFDETTTLYGGHSAYEASSIRIDDLDLGGAGLLRMELGAGGFDGVLGQDVLSRFRVTIDMVEGCLRLDPVER